MYYLPYTWILSVYFCNWTPIQKWIQNQEITSSDIPEVQMETVSPNSVQRRASIDTTVSHISLAEINVVI
ncbi:hypothetical protein GCK72_001581 [Caenorhabditis remanei]|uniref:Uncharacterized protein n=1 Tax=Caenorhabditis remanei TaxID=31234 RepID=A0A6A5HT23_CAERE|nr:hypothetical protein GCK72_001581 [Caenorhabditis remanei]KAF1769764.1 hypothetical protein GCK72_001581 [Caenorhabditis remanei]